MSYNTAADKDLCVSMPFSLQQSYQNESKYRQITVLFNTK